MFFIEHKEAVNHTLFPLKSLQKE